MINYDNFDEKYSNFDNNLRKKCNKLSPKHNKQAMGVNNSFSPFWGFGVLGFWGFVQ